MSSMYAKIIPMSQYQVLNVVTKIAVYKITNIAISQSLLWFYNKIFTAQKKEEHIQKSLDLNIFMHQEESWTHCTRVVSRISSW